MSTKTKKTNSPSTNPVTPAETPKEPKELCDKLLKEFCAIDDTRREEGFQGTPFERAVLERLDLIAGLLRALPGQTQVVQQKGLDLSQFKFKVE